MAIVDRHGLPLSVSTHAANHHEVRLVQLCFDCDRAYDSDPLDDDLRKDGIEMIAPHRYARWTPTSPTCKALAGRTALRLDSMAAPPSRALGVLSKELPWLRATRLPHHPLQTVLR